MGHTLSGILYNRANEIISCEGKISRTWTFTQSLRRLIGCVFRLSNLRAFTDRNRICNNRRREFSAQLQTFHVDVNCRIFANKLSIELYFDGNVRSQLGKSFPQWALMPPENEGRKSTRIDECKFWEILAKAEKNWRRWEEEREVRTWKLDPLIKAWRCYYQLLSDFFLFPSTLLVASNIDIETHFCVKIYHKIISLTKIAFESWTLIESYSPHLKE